MAGITPNPYYYFMYSSEHVDKQNEISSIRGKKFECGTVVVNGKRKRFSYLTSDKDFFIKQYPDARVIAEGYKNKMKYTDCTIGAKKGLS